MPASHPYLQELESESIHVLREAAAAFRKPVILCCSTGNHCWEASDILRNAGVEQVINGGSWQSLWRKVG